MRTIELLLTSAAEQFAEHGFAKASLADISKAAGVTKGALFFHFPTKAELADAVQLRGMEPLEQAVSQRRASETSRLQVIVDMTHALHRLLREDVFLRAGVRITRERPDSDRDAGSRNVYLIWFAHLWQLVDEARKCGELPAGRSLSIRTVVAAAVCGVETLVWTGTAQPDVEEWLSHLWKLTEAGAAGQIRTTARPL
ncbi:TetR/AcrR family transcriptional regulator [Streptomyces sp. Je 1-79]|uniref:ScbR family autoregulator-binding transcription factor n=1 Tax=Streptomyces sp. Je 1-79 TaxID=2943847 RepID=UPI0021A4128D|nr:ScbR family autoregulator-binding transcription factor [Streptomyces sp. Je 1-79]MCT4356213.1 TetR/AcrR family transcriptional regulator [Streptomyces sp. Je 1-79]